MPIIKSAKKRVRVARKATIRNKLTKRNLKSAVKAISSKGGSKSLREAESAIDKALKKHVIHKNKAARLKSQASKQAKAAGIKIAKAATVKKAPASKKTPTKKPAVKAKKK